MDKLTAFSLFDFFAFLIPGLIVLVLTRYCLLLVGISIDTTFLTSNEALRFFLAVFIGYIIGHIIHFTGSKIHWLGIAKIRNTSDSLKFLENETFLLEKLDEKSRTNFSFPLKDAQDNILPAEIERFFEVVFRLLENSKMLQSVRILQTQFIMFCNLYLGLLVSSFFILVLTAFRFQHLKGSSGLGQIAPVILLCIVSSVFSYLIAKQRREKFISTSWWQFFAFFNYHKPS
jgi:hypothetical protein